MLSVSLRNAFPVKQVLSVLIGGCIMTIGSKLQIPCSPVPFTFQTIAVLLIALTCAPSKAFLSVLTWLSLGVCGMPVFAKHSASVIVGPTAGYLWGMLCAVTLMSFCQFHCAGFFNALFFKKEDNAQESLSFPAMILVGSLGAMLILFMGWLNLGQYIGSAMAWNVGVVPFILLEFLKVVGVSMLVSTFQWGKIAE